MADRTAACLALLGFLALPAAAADWPAEFWNPAGSPDDIVLPLPCDGAITFRRVETAAPDNWLADESVQLGNSDTAGQEHSESLLRDSIVGSLSLDGTPAGRFYLIGKYEVTRDQYAAVMNPSCPTPTEDGALPAEAMSWLDAQTFAARLTGWLNANAAGELTAAAGPQAFVRLPSEEEWEFAARGGVAVPEAVQRQRLFPMDGALEDYVWFAGFKSCDGALQPIGLLQPNPLGIHDILGNVQEMTSDLYRLRTRSRPHGQLGGGTARGGSCLTTEARVRTAERAEFPLYDPETGQLAGKPFTGLRPVIGAPILIGQDRIDRINEDWRDIGQTRIQIAPSDDPITTLNRLAETEEDPATREALTAAAAHFSNEMERRNAIESRSAVAVVNAGMLMIRDYIIGAELIVNMEKVSKAGDVDPQTLRRVYERQEITKDAFLASLVHATDDFDQPTLDQAAAIIRKENAARHQSMMPRTRASSDRMLEMFVDFTKRYRVSPDTSPTEFYEEIDAYYQDLRGR